MWPFNLWPFRRKKNPDTPNALQAIAYLKPAAPPSAVLPDDNMPTMELSHDDSPVLTDIGNNLLVAYLVDSGNSFTYVQQRDLLTAGVTETQLHEIGVNNLAGFAQRGNLRVVRHPTNEIFGVLLDGNFEASLILLDSVWDHSFRQFVQGDYVAAIPTRDVLGFCDSRSEIGRKELLTMIDNLKTCNDHPLLHELLVRKNGKWLIEKAG